MIAIISSECLVVFVMVLGCVMIIPCVMDINTGWYTYHMYVIFLILVDILTYVNYIIGHFFTAECYFFLCRYTVAAEEKETFGML